MLARSIGVNIKRHRGIPPTTHMKKTTITYIAQLAQEHPKVMLWIAKWLPQNWGPIRKGGVNKVDRNGNICGFKVEGINIHLANGVCYVRRYSTDACIGGRQWNWVKDDLNFKW